ncbi:GNAT family N-acetyltransferase [Paenibacillaceae bacterium WGS1546]|uniref:GNAT family N-acetyltransferase n=1 Tax=Cohnella sp. WGS1546 TaxID=3366810 RepID=UPI00372CFD06
MIVDPRSYEVKDIRYIVRSASEKDAAELSGLRCRIDGETDHMDREPGEAFLDAWAFAKLIREDSQRPRNLILVAAVRERLVGYSRCEGVYLKRFAHKAEFGVGVLRQYWGYGIGRRLLERSIEWAQAAGIRKMTLNVTETNESAIRLYRSLGFEVEGKLIDDKRLGDGSYRNTLIMGRLSSG